MVIGREIALPVWLVDVLIGLAVFFLVICVELLIRGNLYCFTAVIVRIENYNGIVVGCFHLLQCVSLTLSINADYLVLSLCD